MGYEDLINDDGVPETRLYVEDSESDHDSPSPPPDRSEGEAEGDEGDDDENDEERNEEGEGEGDEEGSDEGDEENTSPSPVGDIAEASRPNDNLSLSPVVSATAPNSPGAAKTRRPRVDGGKRRHSIGSEDSPRKIAKTRHGNVQEKVEVRMKEDGTSPVEDEPDSLGKGQQTTTKIDTEDAQEKVELGLNDEDTTSSEELSAITALPYRKREPIVEGKPSWFGSLFRKSQGHTVTLNPCGDTTVVIRKANGNTSGKAPEFERVKCALVSLKEAASGPLWKDLLEKGNREISVSAEDDEFGMLFFLRVAHGCDLKTYQEKLSFDQLAKVTTVVQKYDASADVRMEVVKRIPENWRAGAAAFLLVAWEFGFEDRLRELVATLVRTVQTNDRGELLDERGKRFAGRFPTAVLEYIEATRRRYIGKLLDLAYDYADQLRDTRLQTCFQAEHDKENCAALMLGTFIRGLDANGLPAYRPNVGRVYMSISALEGCLKTIEGHKLPNGVVPETDNVSDPGEDTSPRIHPNCQKSTLWHFLVNRELKHLDEIPERFERYMQGQKAKWAEETP